MCRDVLLLVPSFLHHIPALSLFITSILAHVAGVGAASLRVLLGGSAGVPRPPAGPPRGRGSCVRLAPSE